MKEKDLVENNKILQIRVGSHLYGTNTEDSDEDYSGIFLPSEEYIYGFKKIDQVDLSKKDKTETGKNTKDAVDCIYYEFRKFIKLALECNPNILEQLFVNKENIIFCNETGQTLLDIRHKFVYQGLCDRFLGYSYSQKHKMLIRSDKFFELNKGLEIINEILKNKPQFISSYICDIFYIKNYDIIEDKYKIESIFRKGYDSAQNVTYVSIGDLNLQPSYTLLKCKKVIEERLSKVGNRKELLLDKGYDYKFGMHCCRLLLEGIELLKTGKLIFPLKYRDLLLSIKKGDWEYQQVIDYIDKLEKEMEKVKDESKLPDRSNYDYIEKYTINILKKHLMKK